MDSLLALISQGLSQFGLNRSLSTNRCTEALVNLKSLKFGDLKQAELAQVITSSEFLAELLICLREFEKAVSVCDIQIDNLRKLTVQGHYLTIK